MVSLKLFLAGTGIREVLPNKPVSIYSSSCVVKSKSKMCMDLHNLAAWSEEPKGDLQIKEAPIPALGDDEILIEVRNKSTILCNNSTS
jgi:hypothetical protein